MKDLDVEKDFGNRIRGLFDAKEHQDVSFIDRGFAYTEKVVNGGVLFIGLNPSFRKGDKYGSFFYNISAVEVRNVRYYKRFWDVANHCNLPCAHLDLLALRETSQKNIETLLNKHTLFIMSCLDLSKDILEATRPQVIVVCDTLARRLLGKDRHEDSNIWLGYNFGQMQTDGTYIIQNRDSNLRGVPVFFSGMLSGQRVLDNGSYERLKWHIKKVIDEQIRLA